jgi:hypothetical protein
MDDVVTFAVGIFLVVTGAIGMLSSNKSPGFFGLVLVVAGIIVMTLSVISLFPIPGVAP